MIIYKCDICGKEFESKVLLFDNYRFTETINGKRLNVETDISFEEFDKIIGTKHDVHLCKDCGRDLFKKHFKDD